jgi:hypothetical protein
MNIKEKAMTTEEKYKIRFDAKGPSGPWVAVRYYKDPKEHDCELFEIKHTVGAYHAVFPDKGRGVNLSVEDLQATIEFMKSLTTTKPVAR